jgi:hypothetical protein
MLMQDYTNQVFGKALDLGKWRCHDERGRVFAILEFIPKDSGMCFIPDYSVEPRDLYIHFAREHVLQEGLFIVLYAGLAQRAGKGLLEYAKGLDVSKRSGEPLIWRG